ncbi:hypothetical protein [Bacillus toyonensis]|uniref:hypothetical protein n=1 Tax=Bacillus toyonensis TaxID=155322 RepID=UPI000BF5A0D7|nr:hypothetical protein [Bacillus toyonensis]PGF05318.1 hypothetical protein COM61_02590 [Bacillus toyonensis]
MLNLEIAHSLLQLKEDHSKLGEAGTVFSVVDYVLDVQTDNTKALLGKPEYNEVLEQVWTLPVCTVTEEEIENLFVVLEEPLHKYEKGLKK